LDPARAADVYGITAIQQIFDGLVQFDENLNVMPAIAESWRVSRDGLTYRFYLKDDVRFHNGREVEAGDFVYSFTRILDPEVKSNAAALFSRILGAGAVREGKASSVEGLRAVDARELEIRLTISTFSHDPRHEER
jgi:peptide/nickel transport system substrate-binding protein/oligopeptide transport system substrate-binding protein